MRGLLVVLLMLLTVGCGRVQNERFTGGAALPDGVEMNVALEPSGALAVDAPAAVQIRLLADGVPVSGALLTVEASMTHAGMEPLFVEASESAPGEYQAPLAWTMGGEWFVVVRGTLPDGRTVEQRVNGLTVES